MFARQVLYLLNHSISPALYWVFSVYGLMNYLPWLASNHNLPDFCLLSS
jgi:hypothetical protein